MVNTRQQDHDGDDDVAETGVTRDFLNQLIAPLAKLSDIESLVSKLETLEKKFDDLEMRFEQKFENLEQRLDEKESAIKSLEDQNQELRAKLSELEGTLKNDKKLLSRQVEQLEAYGRRMCLRIDNIPTQKKETSQQIKKKVLNLCKDLKVNIRSDDIDRIHRIGKKHTNKQNVEIQQVILRMRSWDKRCELYEGRKVARDKKLGIYINLDLTKHRHKLLQKAKEVIDEDSGDYCYADINCRVAVNINDEKFIIETEDDLDELIAEKYEQVDDARVSMPLPADQ